jgi:hypothetical protein
MVYPVKNSKNTNIIYASFLDDTKLDQMNFYNGNRLLDKINVGGRGQLINAILITEDYKTGIQYSLSLNNQNTASSSYGFTFRANTGDPIENIPTDNFGSVGGNIKQNSLDYHEENDRENGYIQIRYLGIHNVAFRNINIVNEDNDIEILADS